MDRLVSSPLVLIPGGVANKSEVRSTSGKGDETAGWEAGVAEMFFFFKMGFFFAVPRAFDTESLSSATLGS